MKKVLKWIGIVLAAVVGLVVFLALAAVVWVQFRIHQSYEVEPEAAAIPTDPASIARGEHLVRSVAGCVSCHGEDLGGMVLLDDPSILTFYAPNLTGGTGGAGARFTPEDWDRAIRHGVGPDGNPLMIMPSQNYRWLTDEDLGAILAYIGTREPVDNEVPEPRLGPMGYLLALTEPAFLPAAQFDHDLPPRASMEPSVSAEYGEYLVWIGTCRDCHGSNLSGKQLPLPDEPPSRNLTPGGEMAGWSEQDFIQTIRTGITPGGHTLRPPMVDVVEMLRGQSDEELTAIFLYLQSLPALEFGAN